MPSDALADLLVGAAEVRALREYAPKAQGLAARHALQDAQLAHRRACVVLLCSYFERYIYALNEGAIDYINHLRPLSELIPVQIRLAMVRGAVDRLAGMQWIKRESALREFSSEHAALWNGASAAPLLRPEPLLESMKSPKVADVKRYFKLFGIDDIFHSIARSETVRRQLMRSLQALADSRNGIAHGDQTVQPERTEITGYLNSVSLFCGRVDKFFGQRLATLFGGAPPW